MILRIASFLAPIALAGAPMPQDCSLPALERDGFVRVEAGHLVLGDQRFLVRGANYGGGKFLAPFGTGREEFWGGGLWNREPFQGDQIEAELAFHRRQFGTNAIRIFHSPRWEPIGASELGRLQQFLCRARRQGIRVHFALLVAVPEKDEHHAEYVAGYSTYLASLLPALADDPTVLAYEIGNEIIKHGSPLDYKVRALRLIRALIEVVRAHAPNHLITSGEVVGGPAPYLSPEFVELHIDGPAAPPVRLEQLVDYLSPHVYSAEAWKPEGALESFGDALRAATAKPVVAGEFGFFWGDEYVLDKTHYAEPQGEFFRRWSRVMRAARAPSGALEGFDGWMAWLPFPILDLRPGRFHKEAHAHHRWPAVVLHEEGRTVHYRDQYDLLYYPDALPGTELAHLPAGSTLRRALTASHDFGGDGCADVAVFRAEAGQWLLQDGGVHSLGGFEDRPAPADYDGDGRTDPAVFRPATGEWRVRAQAPILLGRVGDVPVPADYDGDGEAEIALFRPATAAWIVRTPEGNLVRVLGSPGDVPVPADYDGDGTTDLAVFRPMTGAWTAARLDGSPLLSSLPWGAPGDVPVVGDYDGNGRADLAVYRPDAGRFEIRGVGSFQHGGPGKLPVPADYDGNGRTDVATYAPASGAWDVLGWGRRVFGAAGDSALPAPPTVADAEFIDQSVPSTMQAGTSHAVTITLRNSGTRPWSPVGAMCQAFRLLAIDPWGNQTWGLERVELSGPVDPGQTVALVFVVRAPSAPGHYPFQWQLVQECTQAVGTPTPAVLVEVTP